MKSGRNTHIWLSFGMAASLLLLLLLITTSGTCEALSQKVRSRPGFAKKSAGSEGNRGEAGVTYRPPIVNMNYLGGPVMWKPIHLYFVWYGKWSAAEKNLIRTVSNSLTPNEPIRQHPNLSNLWSIVTEYYQELPLEGRKYATNDVSIAGEVDDDYSCGHNISDSDPLKIIPSNLENGLPTDLEQGVYFLFRRMRFPSQSLAGETVVMRTAKGTIQRGLFFKGVGLQHYAPGQDCTWKIVVHGAKCIHLHFEKVALGYDGLDFVTVLAHDNVIKKQVTGFGKNIQVKVSGCEATVRFVTYAGQKPLPEFSWIRHAL